MKNHNIISVAIRGLAAVALSLGAASSFGATWSNLDDCGVASAGAWGSCASSTTGGGSILGYTGVTVSSSSSTAATSGNVTTSNGYGMYVNSDPAGTTSNPYQVHGIDNSGGIDGIVFKFVSGVQLTSITIGSAWTGEDYDASVYMWTGSGTPSPSTPASLAYGNSSAWTLVSHVMNGGSSNDFTSYTGAVSGGGYSSYWLVSAYTGGQTNDAFKLMALVGNVCATTVSNGACVPSTPPTGQVPEPGSLALLGLGAMGLIAVRRRQQNQQRQTVLVV